MTVLDDERVEALRVMAAGGELRGDAPSLRPVVFGAEPVEPLPALAGFPFLHAGAGAIISGETGRGKSATLVACALDAALEGVPVAYLGDEVQPEEFVGRVELIARRRGHDLDDPATRRELNTRLARFHYGDLAEVIEWAWLHSSEWVELAGSFEIVILDPVSTVGAALGLNFETSNDDYAKFYTQLVQPAVNRSVAVVMLDNIGHSPESSTRAIGASMKGSKADLAGTFKTAPGGLVYTARKVRSERAPFRRGQEWFVSEESRTVVVREVPADVEPPRSFRPTRLMQRASEFVNANPEATQNGVERGVGGKAAHVRTALEVLTAEGHVERRREGQATRYRSLKPYCEADDPLADPWRSTASPQTNRVPNRVPELEGDEWE